jgi:adenylate cyclase
MWDFKWIRKVGLREAKKRRMTLATAVGCTITIGIGLACLRFAAPLERASYDLPFRWRAPLDPDRNGVVLVYLDAKSAWDLHQPIDDIWNRNLHVQLLERLTKDRARLILYDIIFDTPSSDAAIDEAFAEALHHFGHAVLSGGIEIIQPRGGVKQERILAPIEIFRKAAAGWGVGVFNPVDADYVVRQIYSGGEVPAATWRGAEVLGAPVTKTQFGGDAQLRWVNYYGPPGQLTSISLADALGVPAGFFRDKVVMIGGWEVSGPGRNGRDEFATPFPNGFPRLAQGLEVHATILLNYIRSEWLTQMTTGCQVLVVVIVGLLAGLLSRLRPLTATACAVVLAALIAGAACWLVWNRYVWFNWLTPAAVQVPIGLVWAVGSQYLLESRRRKELRRAFGFYLSPEMADRIGDADFNLKPGGKIVEVTVMFTDLENFTTLSEKLDPTEVSAILTSYFGQTTRCIQQNHGTVIKYIGDAVFAAWDAIREPQHAIRAAEAACDLRAVIELEIEGKKLRTRVGIHTGKVLAGNLGSEFRFDYTMIGDAVNFASRLESLNKYLNTQVLLSDDVQRQLDDKFVTRRLGEFKVAGKTESVVIHELLCRREAHNYEHDWIEIFEQGLVVFRAGDFDRARQLMMRTREMRDGGDGPAGFYLRRIDQLVTNGRGEDWTGVVELNKK